MFIKNRFISLAAAQQLCVDLAMRAEVFKPDCVVSVEKGGWFVGDQVAKRLGLPHLQIAIGRFPEEETRSIYAELPLPFHLLGVLWHTLTWNARKPRLLEGIGNPQSLEGKRVLLVDDAVHTGGTMRVAREYLLTFRPTSVDMAALSIVRGFQPMYLCMRQGHYCYPWSRMSPEYGDFLKLYQLGHAA